MILLNIFQHYDGTTAWDNILIILLAFVAGYLLRRALVKNKENQKYHEAIEDWETRHKALENEFKAYKTNITATEKNNHKSVTELSGRVKALEGDIRALSEEKNKYHHQLQAKEDDLKKYNSQVSDLEDRLKTLHDEKTKSETDWTQRLKTAREDLVRASAWESRVRAAEEEAQKARSVSSQAERRKLEAELRLKATAEYAGKVGPLENELSAIREKMRELESGMDNKTTLVQELEIKLSQAVADGKKGEDNLSGLQNDLVSRNQLVDELNQQLQAARDAVSKLRIAMAELELQKSNNAALLQEIEAKNSANTALVSEMELLKTNHRKMAEEYEKLKSEKSGKSNDLVSDMEETEQESPASLEGIGPGGIIL